MRWIRRRHTAPATARRGSGLGASHRRTVVAAAAAGIVAAVLAVPSTSASPVVPREHRVAMFSDSVGLGARHSVPAAFPSDWEVNVVGQPARFVEQLESGPCFWTLTNERCDVRFRLAASPHWFGDHVVIAAGYNYPYWDPARFDRSVDSMVATLTSAGVKHVYWVTLREVDPRYVSPSAWRQVQPYSWYFPEVNDRLEAALDRHPNLALVDFAANANQPGLTYDAIHLNNTGAALYATLVRSAVDSRATAVADSSTTRVEVPGAAGASAAAVNLTTTAPRRGGYLSVHRCDESPPNASVHNYGRDQEVAHAALAPLDAAGAFCITTHASTNLIVDVTGLLRGDGRYVPFTPTRWVDTRATSAVAGGSTLELDVDDIPSTAPVSEQPEALALIVTAVDPLGGGHVTVSSCDPDAEHSNVNYADPATPNLVIVQPDARGTVCFYSSATTHLVVDVLGEFDSPDAGGLGLPAPTVDVTTTDRLFDSRDTGRRIDAGDVLTIPVGARLQDASNSVVLNLTGLDAAAPGYFTLYPCNEGRGTTSSLNLRPGETVANAAIVEPDADGEVCVYTHVTAHVIVDLLGEIGDVFDGFTPVRVLDTRLR